MTERLKGRAGATLRTHTLARDPLCKICLASGKVALATEADHIIALHNGGTNSLDNMQGLCSECHKDKTRADMGWRITPTTGLDGWPC